VKELRNDFVNNKNSNHEENFADKPWVTKTPYDIRNAALSDVVNAYTSSIYFSRLMQIISFFLCAWVSERPILNILNS
jgi:hypothetical protein